MGGDDALLQEITWLGVVLALLGQSLVLAAVTRVRRLGRQRAQAAVVGLLAANALVVVALLALGLIARFLNHGPRDQRGAVIFAHLLIAVLVPWDIYASTLRRATERRAILWGGLLVFVTATGLTLPRRAARLVAAACSGDTRARAAGAAAARARWPSHRRRK